MPGGGGSTARSQSRSPGGITGSATGATFNSSEFAKTLGAGMENAFNQGNQVYQSPLYAGIGQDTRNGQASLYGTAAANRNMMQPAMNWAREFAADGGLTDGQQRNIGAVESLGRGAAAPSMTERNLSSVANGQYLRGANPFFEENLRRASDDTYADVMASLGGSGRTGSSVHVDELTGALGDLQTSARGQQYETERDRQLQALGAIEGQRQQSFNNQLTTANTAFGMGQQGVANRFDANAALPGYYSASQQPARDMLAAGAITDADAQARLMADYDLFQRRDPYSHLARYSSLINGSQNTAGFAPETPWWQTAGQIAVGLL